jgi:tyrosyl-tRNA synthetase
MYQYLLNVADDDVESLLLRLTTVPVPEIAAVVAEHRADPGRRTGQRRVADEITALVHGRAVLEQVRLASEVLFGRSLEDLDEAAFELLADEVPTLRMPRDQLLGADPVDVFAATSLAKSKGEVRRTPAGYYLNQTALAERHDQSIGAGDLRHGRFLLLRRGKASHHLVEAV